MPNAPDSRRSFSLRDVRLIAGFELGESLRTRLLMVMVLLFVGGGALGAWGFSKLVSQIEQKTAQVTGADPAERPGTTLKRARDAGSYRELVGFFVADKERADYFAALPPIVVFFGWSALLFTPWLILITAPETIASEVATRSIRYAALRTGRLEFALGKMAGQALILAGVTALSALAFFVVAATTMAGFEAGATLTGLAATWPRVFCYNLAFLGWAMLASMITASANLARVVAIAGSIGLAIVAALAGANFIRTNVVITAAADVVRFLTPFQHREVLAYPHGAGFWVALGACVGLAALYFAVGYWFLRRRDL
jgi:ABC-type transport system involved in multi-copper enzyme maturation permease subunit